MSKDVKIRDCSNIFGEGGPFQPGMANGNRKEAKGNPKVKRESKFKGTGSKGGHATERYGEATFEKKVCSCVGGKSMPKTAFIRKLRKSQLRFIS